MAVITRIVANPTVIQVTVRERSDRCTRAATRARTGPPSGAGSARSATGTVETAMSDPARAVEPHRPPGRRPARFGPAPAIRDGRPGRVDRDRGRRHGPRVRL